MSIHKHRHATDARSGGRYIRASTLKPLLACNTLRKALPNFLRLATTSSLRYNLATSLFRDGADAPREDIVEAAALMRLCVEQRSQANGPDHPSTNSFRQFEERVLHALESERPAKRARRTLRLRDVDTRGDQEHQEELRIERRVSATTRAEERNEERRRHFFWAAHLKQLQRRMQEQREEQQRSRFRCVVS